MKSRILIIAYIAAVLLISRFSHADGFGTGRGLITNASIHKTTSILSIEGYFSNPCQKDPRVVADLIDNEKLVITLSVRTTITAAMCIETLGPKFEISYDLKELPLRPGKFYTIKFSPARDDKPIELKYLSCNTETYEVYKELIEKVPLFFESPDYWTLRAN
ncbi:MAG: hypothetical protein IT289_03555 [Oligoflexia bacterium]|nr:hypothetical protein [Oligoflexia bacterium]